ncbi:hypothetical protein C8R43DRAFT_1048329 [Mycena crocata]|nr:hypothetical protein C8R43DRAFT_1048329 [Mycena crocata]
MLGPSSILFACVSLLVHLSPSLAATIITRDAPLAPAVVILNALAKGGVSPRCTIACRAVESSYVNAINIPQLCTTLVESQARYCFGCQVTARVEPLAFFQTALNNFASSCSAARIALKTADIDQNVATDPGSDNDSGPAVTPQAPDAHQRHRTARTARTAGMTTRTRIMVGCRCVHDWRCSASLS